MMSTLVETVSINYEDFSESFLTCGTCMCMYDQEEHTPKLLSCSHTVCRHCLHRILHSQARENGTFRCPICRECITLPRGGVQAFPPSFLVNQLLDLMSRQKRDVIPKCSMHTSQELLFCETCDIVFCTRCISSSSSPTGESSSSADQHTSSCEHTVIPFSIAIKRMSEILLYKAHQCLGNLGRAHDAVSDEMRRLDQNVDKTFDVVNKSFQELISGVERRRYEILQVISKIRDEKRKVLQEQLHIIEGEKGKVEAECQGLHYQVEVRNITQKISDLNEKLDSTSTLGDPRENSFLRYDHKHNTAMRDFTRSLQQFGAIYTSKTFPALCSVLPSCELHGPAHIESIVEVMTVDYHGNPCITGGDPVAAELRQEVNNNSSSTLVTEAKVVDENNGLYTIRFTPPGPGTYKLCINIFDRPIRDSPFAFQVDEHHNPIQVYGGKGTGHNQFLQPVSVAISDENLVYITDTGNGRIKVITNSFDFNSHFTIGDGVDEHGVTGISMVSANTLAIINWRSRQVTIVSTTGEFISKFTSDEFVEPVAVAANQNGDVLIADTGALRVFLFDKDGKMVRRLGVRSPSSPARQQQLKPTQAVTAVAFGRNDDVVIADSSIQLFSRTTGRLVREIYSEGKGKGQYGGVCVDKEGHILATRNEKGRGFIQVFNYSGRLLFTIDSFDAKLKRASGIAVTSNHHVVVVDLGNDCVKKFRYM